MSGCSSTAEGRARAVPEDPYGRPLGRAVGTVATMTDTGPGTPAPFADMMAARSGGRWPALTRALQTSHGPLMPWLADRFPTRNRRPVFTRYRDSVGPILVPAGAASTGGGSGAVGGSFDYLVRFLVEPRPVNLPAIGAHRFRGRMPTALAELSARLGAAPPSPAELFGPPTATVFDGPQSPTMPDAELLARGCWALSLLTELARGVPPDRSPLAELDRRTVSGDDLLGLALPAALDQLAALREQAESVLLPALSAQVGRWVVGPTFEGSALMNADADLIAAGTLLEIKTVLGSTRTDGTRYATIDAQMLFQLLGYVLLDFHDEFAIHEVALFSARYGHLAVWDLQELLDTVAGHPVDVPALRAEFERFLHDGPDQAGAAGHH